MCAAQRAWKFDPGLGEGKRVGSWNALGATGRLSAVSPHKCARLSCLSGPAGTRARGAGWGRGAPRHVLTHLPSPASQVFGPGRRQEQRLPVREGRGGGEPPPDPFPSPFILPTAAAAPPRGGGAGQSWGAEVDLVPFCGPPLRYPSEHSGASAGCQPWGGLHLPQHPGHRSALPPPAVWGVLPWPSPGPARPPQTAATVQTRLKRNVNPPSSLGALVLPTDPRGSGDREAPEKGSAEPAPPPNPRAPGIKLKTVSTGPGLAGGREWQW